MRIIMSKDIKVKLYENGYYAVIEDSDTMKIRGENAKTELEVVYMEKTGQVVYMTADSDDTVVLPALESAYYVEWGDFQFYAERSADGVIEVRIR